MSLKELRYGALLHTIPHSMSAPAEHFASRARSVDGYPLPIDELKGTKPTEKIDLSNKKLGVASATIITSCIKGNGSLKELRYGAHLHTIPHSIGQPPLNTCPPLAVSPATSSAVSGKIVMARSRAPTPPRASPRYARGSRVAP